MKTIREVVDLTVGTHKVGDLEGVSYTELVKIFGLPTFWPEDNFDGKVNFEWVIQMGDTISLSMTGKHLMKSIPKMSLTGGA